MVTVIRHPNESFEAMFKRFRKRAQQAKIKTESRKRRFFEKPSQERQRASRRKLNKSRKTTFKDLRAKH